MLTASTNRHLLQPTKANRARRKSRIESIQHSADKGKHRAPATSTDQDESHNSAKAKPGRGRASSKSSDKSKTKSKAKQKRKSGFASFFTHDAGNSNDDDSDSGKSARSQLVDLIVEDQEAEELDRVRARKEGSPEWNRSEPRRYV